ncbi:MAG TPA: hypothetical protein PLV92_22885, partial [Pirellulaceae bacterium]|nr:hypothetical protein [Pirellulaceae bacterium]
MLAAGGSSAAVSDEFPLPRDGETPTAEQLVAEWDRLCGGDSLDRLEARLIRQIRQWRPEILVIDDLVRADGKPACEILYHVSLQAVQRAAEPDSRPEQLDPTMPEPWKVKKVFAALPAGERGTVNLTPAQLAPRVGRSLSDIAATGRAHLLDQFQPSPSLVGFRLILDLFPQELGRRDFLSGSMLQPGGDGRRVGTGGARADSAELNRSAQKQRNIQQLLLRSSNNPAQSAAWLAQLDELTRGIGKSAAGDLSWQLAQRYQQQGQHSLAAEMLQQLVKRDATHELSDAALVWLVQYYGSAEFAWRRERMAAAQNSDDVAVAAATGLNRLEIEPSAVAESPTPAVAAAPTPTRSQSGLVGSGLVNSQLAPGSRAASSKKNIAQAGYVADDGDDARRAGSSQFGGGVARAGYVAPIAPMGAGASAGQAGASGPAALSGPVAPAVPADSAGTANLPNAVGASAAPPVVQLGEFIERTRPALATE